MAIRASAQNDLLAMALVGYEREKVKIEATIADIKAQLGLRGPGRPKAATGTAGAAAPAGRRTLSASARRRIAEAQRKRWAAIKGTKTAAAKPKRRLSAAGRKAIIEATKKRWAAFHKADNAKKATKKAASQSAAAAS
jgi:hypothetical protein